MPPTNIFARIQPKSVKVTEKYYYVADSLNHFMRVKQEQDKPKEPEGSLEVSIPYDGEKFFTPQALTDIHRQFRRIWRRATATARIGFLGFANYGRSGLEGKSDFPLEHDALPLDVPIKGPDLPAITHSRQADKLLRGYHQWYMKQTYTPKAPPAPPVKLSTQSYDEASADEFDQRLSRFFDKIDAANRGEKSKAPTSLEKQRLITFMTQQEDLQSTFSFAFQVNLQLQHNIAQKDEKNLPKIESLTLHWPVPVAAEQVALDIGRKKAEGSEAKLPQVYYVPDAEQPSVLEWRDITLNLPGKGDLPEKGPYTYKSPTMRLQVKQPGELYKVADLNGTVEIKIPQYALSGLHVQFFDATGQQSGLQTEMQSQVFVDFTIGLQGYADGKAFIPYQQLQFEGLTLDRSRVTDIQMLLTNLGLISRAAEVTGLPGPTYYLIRGEQARGLGEIKLWILGEGTPAYTHRTTVLPGGQSYSTSARIGHTKFYLRGQTIGNSSALLELMNKVHQNLKTLFHHLKAID